MKECSICRGGCSSTHERVPRYLRPECLEEDQKRSRERVDAAVRFATEKAKERNAAKAAIAA